MTRPRPDEAQNALTIDVRVTVSLPGGTSIVLPPGISGKLHILKSIALHEPHTWPECTPVHNPDASGIGTIFAAGLASDPTEYMDEVWAVIFREVPTEANLPADPKFLANVRKGQVVEATRWEFRSSTSGEVLNAECRVGTSPPVTPSDRNWLVVWVLWKPSGTWTHTGPSDRHVRGGCPCPSPP
jgi:hypothetical protein